MNEEIKKKLEENAVGLLEFVEKSKDFVLEQAPLYVQELVAFHFISNAATLTGILIFFFTVLIFFIKSFKYGLKHEFEDFPHVLFPAISGLLLIASVLMVCDFGAKVAIECYKAKYAPRVLIIEKLRGQ